MKLKSLTLENFFSHKKSSINFDNIDQICMIVGESEVDSRTSNGVGKTTILEAIKFALFERTRLTDNKNATLDDVVRWDQPNEMKLDFQFEHNFNLYRIIRTRDVKKSKGILTFDVFSSGVWKSQTEATKALTNAAIIKTIGIDYETFSASICFEHDEVDVFVKAGESQRKQIIKNILRLDQYDDDKASALLKLKNLTNEFKIVESQLATMNVNVLDIEAKEQELIEVEQRLKVRMIEKQAIEKQLEQLRAQQTSFNDQVEKKQSLARQLVDKTNLIARLNNQIEQANIKQQDYIRRLTNKQIDLDKLMDDLNEILKQSFDESQIRTLGKQADKDLKAAEQAALESSQHHFKLIGELERLESNINSLQKLESSSCPTCYMTITKESTEFLLNHKQTLTQRAETSQAAYNYNNQQVENCKKQLERAKQQLQDYGKWAREKLHLQDSIKIQNASIDEAKMIITDQESILTQNKESLDKYKLDIINLQAEHDAIIVDVAAFNELNKKIVDKNNKLNDTDVLLSKATLTKGSLSTEIERYKGVIKQTEILRRERERLTRECFYYKELVEIIGKQIPTLIIENACTELSREANQILEVLSGDVIQFVTQRANKDGSLKEVFEIEVSRPGISKESILLDSLSNGEKFRIVFAIRIALSRLLVERRSASPVEFLFYDECFSSLDEKGLDEILEIFATLKANFRHQFIITHRKDLKERLGDSIILVKKSADRVSKIEV